MRYETEDLVTFVNSLGKTVEIRDMREYPDYSLLLSMKLKPNDEIDEIASRTDVYGDGAEDRSYKIVDFNRVKMVENDFDLSKFQELKIPL